MAQPVNAIVKAKIRPPVGRAVKYHLELEYYDGSRDEHQLIATNESDAMLAANLSYGLSTALWSRNLWGTLVWRRAE